MTIVNCSVFPAENSTIKSLVFNFFSCIYMYIPPFLEFSVTSPDITLLLLFLLFLLLVLFLLFKLSHLLAGVISPQSFHFPAFTLTLASCSKSNLVLLLLLLLPLQFNSILSIFHLQASSVIQAPSRESDPSATSLLLLLLPPQWFASQWHQTAVSASCWFGECVTANW